MFKLKIICLVLVLSSIANAALIDHGTYLTDTISGLDWLKVTQTIGLSYNEVKNQMNPGGAYSGWSYATGEQFNELINNAGGTPTCSDSVNYCGWSTTNNGVVSRIVQVMGSTWGNGVLFIGGRLSDMHSRSDWVWWAKIQDDSAFGYDASTGDYIETHAGVFDVDFKRDQEGSFLIRISENSTRVNTPVPTNQSAWNYASIENPIKETNPADCKPFAVGDLSSGNLSLEVGLPAFSQGVDVYLAIGFADALFLVDGSNVLHSSTEVTVLPRWKTNNSAAIDESLYGDIPTSLLPSGVYNLYTLVVPTGETDFSSYYFWATSFNVGN